MQRLGGKDGVPTGFSVFDPEEQTGRRTRDIKPPPSSIPSSAISSGPPIQPAYASGGPDGLQLRHMQSLEREEKKIMEQKQRDLDEQADADALKEKSMLQSNNSNPKFLYGDLIGAALIPPLLVILAFGGRPSVMVLCFGSLGAYIFDLLGSAEVAILFLSIMFISLWVSLIWSAKFLLRDSIFNFHIVAIMGVILLYAFMLCAAVFNSIRREFDGGLRLFETCAFGTLPLFAASLLTWFLCIEMPDLSLPAVFTVIYYVYAFILTKPRVTSEAVNEARRVGSADGYLSGRHLILHSVSLRLVVLCLPVVMVPALYCFMYRPYVVRTFASRMFTLERMSGLILSFISPGYLACALIQESFEVYFKDHFSSSRSSRAVLVPMLEAILEGVKLLGLCVAALCLENSPLLNDLKDHSGMERRTCTLVLSSIGLLLGMAMLQFRRGHVAFTTFGPSFGAKKDDDADITHAGMAGRTGLMVTDTQSMGTKMTSVMHRLIYGSFLPRTLTAFAITAAAFLMAMLLRMPAEGYPLVICGALAISEYYVRWRQVDSSRIRGPRGWLVFCVTHFLVGMGALQASLAALTFCKGTLLELEFAVGWEMRASDQGILGVPDRYAPDEMIMLGLSARTLCYLFSGLVFVAVALPATARPEPRKKQENVASAPTSGNNNTSSSVGGAGSAGTKDKGKAALLLHEQILKHARDATEQPANGPVPFSIANLVFCTVFFIVNIGVALVELLLRENDWSRHGLSPEQVYPVEVFVLVAGLLVAVSLHLTALDVLPKDAMLCVVEIQACKCLHLAGLPASSIFSAAVLLITITIPFSNLGEEDSPLSSIAAAATSRDGGHSTASPAQTSDFDDLFGVILYGVMISLSLVFARKHLLDLILSRLLSRSVSSLQVDALAVTIWTSFVSSLLYAVYLSPPPPATGTTAAATRMRRNSVIKRLQAALLVVAGIAALLAFEAFGPLTIRLDRSSSTFLVIESHPEMMAGQRTDQSGLFLLSTAMLGLLAAADVIPARHSSLGAGVFFAATMYSTAQFLLWFLFPHSLGKDNVSYGLFALPSVYCYLMAALGTAISLACSLAYLSTPKLRKLGVWAAAAGSTARSRGPGGSADSPVINVLMAVFVSLPVPAVCYTYLSGKVHLYRLGIVWGAISGCAVLALTLRLISMVCEVQATRSAAVAGQPISMATESQAGLGSTLSTLCALASGLCVMWTVVMTFVSPIGHIDADLAVPLSGLVLLTSKKGAVVDRMHPLSVAGAVACLWWLLLSLHCLFLEGVHDDPLPADFVPDFGLLTNAVVSVWLCNRWYVPAYNAFLLLWALPGVYAGLVRKKSDSDDVSFVYSLMSGITMITANAACIRYLGFASCGFAAWRSYDIQGVRSRSNQLV